MKSISNLNRNIKHSVVSDELVDFHASRIVVLLAVCGIKNKENGTIRIKGMTKFAKLDFFLRYPEHFKTAANHLGVDIDQDDNIVESKMIRFHYGPWDDRYNQVLPFLLARSLIQLKKVNATYELILTKSGIELFNEFNNKREFQKLIQRTKNVKKVMGKKSGTFLKELIYELFVEEVSEKELKDIIN